MKVTPGIDGNLDHSVPVRERDSAITQGQAAPHNDCIAMSIVGRIANCGSGTRLVQEAVSSLTLCTGCQSLRAIERCSEGESLS
jgi:hypothetical protein